MQKFYPYKVLASEIQTSDKTTFSKKLPVDGQATGLLIEAKGTNGGTSNIANMIIDCITRMEITGDGVDKILSMAGYPLWKYLWAVFGKPSIGSYTEWPSEDHWTQLIYPFGRYLGDQEYMLNLNKYKEVVLDIDYDLNKNNNVGATGFLTGTFNLKIDLLKTLPGVTLPSKGCRRLIERKSWTTLASGDEEWEFVQDYPYTAVMAYCKPTTTSGQWFTDMKLDLGGGKPILIDRTFEMIHLRNARERNIDPTFVGKYMASDGDYIYTHGGGVSDCNPKWIRQGAPVVDGFQRVYPARLGGEYVQLAVANIATAGDATQQTTDQKIAATTKHHSLGEVAIVELADYPNWNNPLMPADVRDAILRMTQQGAGGAGKVFTEQILPQ